MVRRLLLLATMLLCWQTYAYGNEAAHGWCEAGATIIITSGLNSNNFAQGSFPSCTISVFTHGGGLATIYSDNSNTPLANPFTASPNGQWIFYAAQSRVDVTMSGGGLTGPVTYSDILLSDPAQDATNQCVLAPSTTPAFNAGICSIFSMTLTAAAAASISGGIPGQSITVSLTQGSGGPWAFTWPASFVNPPTLTQVANASAQFRFVLLADGLWHHSGTGESLVYNTAQYGNQFYINGVQILNVSGTGGTVLLQTSPAITTPVVNAGTFNNAPNFTGNPIFTGAPTFKGPIPWIDALEYGAKCDGATDDSAALQAAGNAALASGGILVLPPGTCIFGTSLTFTKHDPKTLDPTITIRGAGIGTILKYTGTGDAMTFTSGVSATYIYNVTLLDFQLWGGLSAPAGRAIVCQYCDQGIVDNVQILGLQNPVTQTWGFTIAFDWTNSAGMTMLDSGWNDVGIGVKAITVSNIIVQRGFTFGCNIDFLMGGGGLGITIKDGLNYEAQNYFMKWDDALGTPTPTFVESIHVVNNIIVMDQAGGSSGTYTPQRVLGVSNTGSNILSVSTMDFTGNTLYCPNTSAGCSSAYPFNLAIANGSSGMNNLTIQDNWIFGWTTGGLTTNSANVNGVWTNNYNVNGSSVALPSTAGSGVFCSATWNAGILSVCPVTTTAVNTGTLAATSTITGVGITDTAVSGTNVNRLKASQGTTLVPGDFALSSGWGTSPSLVVNFNSKDQGGTITISAGTGTPTANPTVTLTFHDGTWTLDPSPCPAWREDLASPTAAASPFVRTSESATAITWTFVGTPLASTNYVMDWICLGH